MDEDCVQDMTQNGNCSRCGECCGLFIPFTETELKKIKKYVKQNNIKPTNRIDLSGNLHAYCCFYDKDIHKCNIYSVRPFVCKHFMCNRENWRELRDSYEERAKYNSTINKKILATFDDLIFEDYTYIIRYVLSLCVESDGTMESKKFVEILKSVNRLDLLNYIKAVTVDGKECAGKDLENLK